LFFLEIGVIFYQSFFQFGEGLADQQLKTTQWLSLPTQLPEQWELQGRSSVAIWVFQSQ
jgi:hypothetical protein